MKRLLSCLLILCLALGLCACAASPTLPAAVLLRAYAKTAVPAPTAPVYPLPEPTPGPWLEAYRRLVEDPEALAEAIGAAADYRTQYFSYDPSLLDLSAYALADLNEDEVPELLLYADGTGLTDVFTYDGGLRYLGYDNFFGFVSESGSAVVHGHWHGAGGSGVNEYSVRELFAEEDRTTYFDYLESEGERCYSVYADEGSYNGTWARPGKDKKGETLYRELYERYVLGCVRLEDVPFFAMDNPEGLERPCNLKIVPSFQMALGTFPYTCEDFLTGEGWEALGLDLGEEKTLRALLFDLDGDGLDELLLLSGQKTKEPHSYVFRYDAAGDRFICLGEGPTEPYAAGGELYGREGSGKTAVWTEFRKTRLGLTGSELDADAARYIEKYESPEKLNWQSLYAVTASVTGEAFNTDELARAAAEYYKRQTGFRPPEAEVFANADGTFTIHLYEILDDGNGLSHTATSAWYTVDEFGVGYDDIFDTPVDFSK